jgi:hypothetical protein
MPYRIVKPPVIPCPGCTTSCTLSSSANPSNQGDSVTFTCTVSNSDGSAVPQGNVSFTVDGSEVCNVALDAHGQAACSHTFSTAGTFTVEGTYQPNRGWVQTTCQLSQVVNSSGITTACCPSDPTPTRLFVTFSNGTGSCTCLNGFTVEIDHDAGLGDWHHDSIAWPCNGQTGSFTLTCSLGTWSATMSGCQSGIFPMPSLTCNPFSLSWSSVPIGSPLSPCCNGNVDITITP